MGSKAWSLAVVLGALLPFSASASLGGDMASVQADQKQLNATLRTTDVANYTLFEIQTPAGVVVREFVSPAGFVFAVAWEGPSLPDLRQLLGRFFTRFVEADDNEGARAGPRVIEQPGLVVYAGGRMRAFMGRAFVPDLIPKGVSREDIH